MRTVKFLITGCLVILGLFPVLPFACKKEKPAEPTPYQLSIPEGFPNPIFSDINPLTVEGVALGRKLYYDTLLSSGGPRSGRACASCHLQTLGFTSPNAAVLPHINLTWNKHFLWNGMFTGSLEDMMKFEVNGFFEANMENLIHTPDYPPLYQKAFGTSEITTDKTAFAIAQFIRTLVSGNSQYDKFLRKEAPLSGEALRGYNIFFSEKGDCYHCHGSMLFTDNDFHNNGLASNSTNDMGRFLITHKYSDLGKFKTPTLRNVGLRNVFMHDGRMKTLKEVILHYNSGILHSQFLDPILERPNMNLSDAEMNDLIAFLHSLTDETFRTNPAHSKP